MLRRRPKRFSLGIGEHDLSVVDAERMQVLATLPLADYLPGGSSPACADWLAGMEALLAQVSLPVAAKLVLTVSDVWVRYFILDVPNGVGSLDELRTLAAGRFERLFGKAPNGWQLRADWKSAGSMLVCAMPVGLLDELDVLAIANQWYLGSIQSHALRLLDRYHRQIPDDCWLCCSTLQGMLALLVVGGEIQHVRHFSFAEAPTPDLLCSLLEAETLRTGREQPGQLFVLGIPPEMSANRSVSSMQLILVPNMNIVPPGAAQMPESLYLSLLGART